MGKWQSASFAVATATIMLTSACGTGTSQSQATGVQPAGQADAAYGKGKGASGSGQPQGGPSKPKPADQLRIGNDNKLGPVLTDSEGFTLYRFDKDTADPPKSNCDGDCATAWPPVPASDVSSAAGIDPSLLGEVTRADGTQQLTVAGWPMYRFAKDTKPGQVKGEKVGGTWFAAAPDGTRAGADGTGGADQALPPLSTVNDPKFGKIIRDGKGRTLYRFTKDSAWPMKSNCTGVCLGTWKPAEPVDKAEIQGIDAKLVSTYTRPDGTEQLAIDCWPLYWYTGDEKPGDTNGQGVGGSWFVVAPDGRKIETPAG